MFQPEDPRAVLEELRLPVKRAGGELVSTCPFCQKPGHLYVNAVSGLWKCQRCGESGNLHQLRARLGQPAARSGIQPLGQAIGAASKRIPVERVDAMHRALLADEEAVGYCLSARKWSEAIVKRMRLGLRVDGRGKWLAFPWWRRGACVGMKYRILPAYQARYPQRFDREPGCESVLFNVDALEQHETIILASGESDAMALLSLGFENVVATTTGETALPASAVDALSAKAKVLIPFDNDDAGQKGAREIGKRIGFDRTWLVPLPAGVKDVNDFVIQGGARERFADCLAVAVQFDVPSIYSLGQALDRLEEEKAIGSWDEAEDMTPWPSVNRRVGRWRGGNLIVLSGPQGTGKTTWTLNVAASWAARGLPALVYCLEMTVEELVQHVLCAHFHLPEGDITAPVIEKARQELADWPLYLGANPRVTGRKEVMDLLGQAVRRYGLRLAVFDNLHVLSRSIEHRTEEVGVLSKSFKLLAMEYEIPLVLVAQPRKLTPGALMTPWDLKDSVDIFSDADQVILLHRELVAASTDTAAVDAAASAACSSPHGDQHAEDDGSADNFSPVTLVRLAKGRHMPSRDATLYFEGAQHRFRELTEAERHRARPEREGNSGPRRTRKDLE